MKLISVNVSKPRLRRFRLKFVTTAFQKKPVNTPVKIDVDNLVGDKQADLLNHGGLDKAVYGFSLQHFDYWQRELNLDHIGYGKFGENLTISDLDEKNIAIGDRFQINDCILEVSQPRIPCYKISYEFQDVAMLNKFIAYGHTGVYFRVIQPGTIEAGNQVKLIHKHPENLTVHRLFDIYFNSKSENQEQVMKQAVAIPELAEAWKTKLKDRLHLIELYHQRQQRQQASQQ